MAYLCVVQGARGLGPDVDREEVLTGQLLTEGVITGGGIDRACGDRGWVVTGLLLRGGGVDRGRY